MPSQVLTLTRPSCGDVTQPPSVLRAATVLAHTVSGAAPPGVDLARFATALLEDTYELVAGLAGVEVAVHAALAADLALASSVVWPGTPVRCGTSLTADGWLRDALMGLPAFEVPGVSHVVVAGDAPDLPPLLLGKLFSALTGAEVAVCPAVGGGLVALGVRGPGLPEWFVGTSVGLDDLDALSRLRAAAPDRRLVVGPGWRRLRQPSDVAHLDPGLEGWDATRAVLQGRPL